MGGIGQRQRELLRLLWQEGRLSRWELHEKTNVNPNAIGAEVGDLLEQRILRECPSEPVGPGRPRVPLEIDPASRHVVGLAIGPGRVDVARLNLRGQPIGQVASRRVEKPGELVAAAVELYQSAAGPDTLAAGLSATGFIDARRHSILFSSALPESGGGSLEPVYRAAGATPIVLENNMHALAAQWLLAHQAESGQDVLLAQIEDGEFGAAMLIEGRPNRGCVAGANELGHTRFFVETKPCYCGHQGCLERICSSDFLARRPDAAAHPATLARRAAAFDGTDAGLVSVIDFVSAGLANAVNFIRPNRLVLVSEFTRNPSFGAALTGAIRGRLLVELADRVRVELWDQPATHAAETAGWLALASLYREGWDPADANA